jgi:hypothetical protein
MSRAGQCSSRSFELWRMRCACLGDAQQGRNLNGACEAGCVVPEARRSTLLRAVYEAALSFFGFAEFGDYGEVFEGSGVAFDFAVGG